jgi:hypothetical protein
MRGALRYVALDLHRTRPSVGCPDRAISAARAAARQSGRKLLAHDAREVVAHGGADRLPERRSIARKRSGPTAGSTRLVPARGGGQSFTNGSSAAPTGRNASLLTPEPKRSAASATYQRSAGGCPYCVALARRTPGGRAKRPSERADTSGRGLCGFGFSSASALEAADEGMLVQRVNGWRQNTTSQTLAIGRRGTRTSAQAACAHAARAGVGAGVGQRPGVRFGRTVARGPAGR